MLTATPANADTARDDFTKHAGELVISDSVRSYSQNNGANFITVIGKMKSRSAVTLENIVLEVQFYNSNKVLIDSVSQELYSVVVPPSSDVTFRVRDDADKAKNQYSYHVIKVIGAEQRDANQSNKKKRSPGFLDFLISWGPIVVLIAVWVFFIRQMYKRNSPQNRSLALIDQQNKLFMHQNELLERLASAVEKHVK